MTPDRDEAWGPWVKHTGDGCPVKGRLVEVERRNGVVTMEIAETHAYDRWGRIVSPSLAVSSSWLWGFNFDGSPKPKWKIAREVIHYRVRRPGGFEVIRELLENLPEKETV